MRRNVKNDKVLRAMAIGLATMIAATSTPVAVFAGENENAETSEENKSAGESQSSGENKSGGENQSSGGSQQSGGSAPSSGSQSSPSTGIIVVNSMAVMQTPSGTTTVTESANHAAGVASAAGAYTGTLQDGQTAATGQIGTLAQGALDDIANANSALAAEDALYNAANTVDEAVGRLLNDKGKENGDGTRKIYSSESLEKGQEETFGVTLDENGNVIDQTGLDEKVSGANTAIGTAEGKKKDAYEALDGVDQAVKTLNAEDGKIANANEKKGKADTDTEIANEAIATKAGTDAATQKKLDDIADTLNKAVVGDNIKKAVEGTTKASADAAQVAGDQLVIVQGELQKAKDAADDAEQNSGKYSRKQMQDLAETAHQAAVGAQKAQEAADQALSTAQTNEGKAKKAVEDASKALKDTKDEAAGILTEYRKELNRINGLIDTANTSRGEAQTAMIEANAAIDAALKLMKDPSNGNAQDAEAMVNAMNNAIGKANAAIEKVTGLIPAYDYKNDPETNGKRHPFNDAVKKYTDTNTRLTTQINNLNKAEIAYKEAIGASGEAAANKESADKALVEIDKLINGIEDEFVSFYEKWSKDIDTDINDIRALLTTGYTYAQLQQTIKGIEENIHDKEKDLKDLNKVIGGSEEDTVEDIIKKFDDAAAAEERINGAVTDLEGKIEEQEKILSDCNDKLYGKDGTPGLNDQRQSAWSVILGDYSALNGKYKYTVDDSGNLVYEMKDGKYVYTDAYNDLVEKSEGREASTWEYMCGEEILAKDAEPDCTDKAGNIYMKDGDGVVIDTNRPIGLSDNAEIGIAGGPGISFTAEYNSENDRIEHYIGYNYYEDIEAGTSNSDNQLNKNFYTSASQSPSDLDVLAVYLSGLWNANLTANDLKVNSKGIITVELDNGNTTRLTGNQVEVHNITYNFSEGEKWEWVKGNPKHPGYWVFNPKYNNKNKAVTITVTEEADGYKQGSFYETKAYDYKKYVNTEILGDYTSDALAAQKQLKGINKNADDAKKDFDTHRQNYNNTLGQLTKVNGDYADAWAALYGDSTSNAENYKEGSLADQKNKADAAKSANDNILTTLGPDVSSYKTLGIVKAGAEDNLRKADEFDPDTAENLSPEDRAKYEKALKAKDDLAAAKARAVEYQSQAEDAMDVLEGKLAEEKDALGKYNSALSKIKTAQARLQTVQKKLNGLRTVYNAAVGALDATNVDTKITLDNGEVIDLAALEQRIDSELSALKKFDPDAYDAISHVYPGNLEGPVEVISIDYLSQKLAAAINTATGILETEQKNYNEAVKVREGAEEKVKEIRKLAKEAQNDANRAAKALDDWRPRVKRDDGDDDHGDEDTPAPSSGGPVAYVETVTPGGLFGPVLFGGSDGTVTQTRTRTVASGATADSSGVLGVRSEEETTDAADKTKKNDAEQQEDKGTGTKSSNGTESLTKVENPRTPLDSTPFSDEAGMNWLWLAGIGSVAGVGALTYANQKRKAANAGKAKKK